MKVYILMLDGEFLKVFSSWNNLSLHLRRFYKGFLPLNWSQEYFNDFNFSRVLVLSGDYGSPELVIIEEELE